ncbi:hypothetical protein AVD48_15625 [Salmonella enterica subsp. enterica serovar Java]|nr:hypothetical protein [Salmonella enterica]EBV8497125.1 hypothetical protein [Salmonella enterica subsp. enterica serovar Java]EAV0849202.1 hypothetical protein [Salmonella enterica]EBI4218372.1 hypothetical protein [Salmonella enterica]EBW5004510.1 hypothetical protein [Salmonella enterica subsp. enterica serovar Java]
MFKVYNKLLYYVLGKRYLAFIAITVTVISTFLTVGAYYYLNAFLKQLIVVGDIRTPNMIVSGTIFSVILDLF